MDNLILHDLFQHSTQHFDYCLKLTNINPDIPKFIYHYEHKGMFYNEIGVNHIENILDVIK